MNSFKTLLSLAVVCIALQTSLPKADAAALEAVKEAAKAVVSKSAEKAGEAPAVEQTGGVRQTALHAVADVALDKGMMLLEAKYPAVKLAKPIAKNLAVPLMNKAHEKINGMFKGTTAAPEGEAAATTEGSTEAEAKDGSTEKTEATEATTEDKKSEESTTAPAAEDGAATTEASGEQKPGLMNKIKSFVKGESKTEEDTPKAEDEKKEGEKKEEKKEEKKDEKKEEKKDEKKVDKKEKKKV